MVRMLILVAVLAWETVIEALLESEFMASNGHPEDGAAAHLVRVHPHVAYAIQLTFSQSMYGLSSRDDDETEEVSDPDSVLLRVSTIRT
jgi:hypothetical protein